VRFESITEAYTGFNLAGPEARAILSTLTDTPLDNESFRFMRSKQAQVAGIDAILLRVSFSGDLGWEIYVPVEQQLALYNALLAAGEPYGMVPVGSRSLLSLRLEKGYGSWGREYSPEYRPQEVGMEHLIKPEKADFLGRDAYIALKDNAPREQLVMLEIDVTTADASGGEPVFSTDGLAVGHITSGAYGHSVGVSLALGFIRTPYLEQTEFDVAILGKPHRARILHNPLFDPQGERLRS
jgi:dimethylglycine dehydrogenase